jgi:hypothetical protein
MVAATRALATLIGTTLGLAGCGGSPTEVNGSRGQTLSVTAGQELSLTLQSIGPGEYVSPPTVSSSALSFLDVQLVGPAVPAGVTQRFRFAALRHGRAIVVFHHTGQSRTVEDTVDVR